MRIVVIGAGAMGSLFTCLLSQSYLVSEIWLLDKNKSKIKSLKNTGLRITGLTKFFLKPEKLNITNNPAIVSQSNLILIFVKSYNTKEVVKKIANYLSENTIILTLQNGLNNIETIEKILNEKSKNKLILNNICAGITSHGATLIKNGLVKHAGKGETIIGPGYRTTKIISLKLKEIQTLFNSANIITKVVETPQETKQVIWSKLVINSAINPVGAITGLRNGQLIESEPLSNLLYSIAEESNKVATKKRIKLLYPDIRKKINEVCLYTKNNINSMLQDILNNKQTEIDYINGAIINEANNIGVNVPLNRAMYFLVKELQKIR
jgi:2-dehydropantoate 2-reductase